MLAQQITPIVYAAAVVHCAVDVSTAVPRPNSVLCAPRWSTTIGRPVIRCLQSSPLICSAACGNRRSPEICHYANVSIHVAVKQQIF